LVRRISTVYVLCAGVCIPVLWAYLLWSGIFGRLRTEPVFSAAVIGADLLAAILALSAGIGTLAGREWAERLRPVAVGMVAYAVMLASGEFLQVGHVCFSVVFLVLTVLSAAVVALNVGTGKRT
jgi:hypothetical protein